jgi:hypothetical protein
VLGCTAVPKPHLLTLRCVCAALVWCASQGPWWDSSWCKVGGSADARHYAGLPLPQLQEAAAALLTQLPVEIYGGPHNLAFWTSSAADVARGKAQAILRALWPKKYLAHTQFPLPAPDPRRAVSHNFGWKHPSGGERAAARIANEGARAIETHVYRCLLLSRCLKQVAVEVIRFGLLGGALGATRWQRACRWQQSQQYNCDTCACMHAFMIRMTTSVYAAIGCMLLQGPVHSKAWNASIAEATKLYRQASKVWSIIHTLIHNTDDPMPGSAVQASRALAVWLRQHFMCCNCRGFWANLVSTDQGKVCNGPAAETHDSAAAVSRAHTPCVYAWLLLLHPMAAQPQCCRSATCGHSLHKSGPLCVHVCSLEQEMITIMLIAGLEPCGAAPKEQLPPGTCPLVVGCPQHGQ